MKLAFFGERRLIPAFDLQRSDRIDDNAHPDAHACSLLLRQIIAGFGDFFFHVRLRRHSESGKAGTFGAWYARYVARPEFPDCFSWQKQLKLERRSMSLKSRSRNFRCGKVH